MGGATITRCRPLVRRRDRVAHQIALTFTTALLLLVAGGVWWLVIPASVGTTGRVDPFLMLTPTASPAPIPQVVAPAPIAAEPGFNQNERAVEKHRSTGPTFNGRPLRKARTIRMLVTAYSPDERSCPGTADNITASGYSVWTNAMKMVAADTRVLPFGSIISIPGYDEGRPVPVLDRGGAIKGRRLDVLYPTHEVARTWGKRWVDVVVWEYAR